MADMTTNINDNVVVCSGLDNCGDAWLHIAVELANGPHWTVECASPEFTDSLIRALIQHRKLRWPVPENYWAELDKPGDDMQPT